MMTSCSGLDGNFGQAQYGSAKMGLVGLMKSLALEGRRNDVRVNCRAPTAATGMTEGILEEQALAALDPALVAPGMLALVCDDAPNGMILCAGAGSFECAHLTLTQGLYVGADAHAPERILAGIDRIRAREIGRAHV